LDRIVMRTVAGVGGAFNTNGPRGLVERTLNVSYSKKDPVEAEAEGTLLM
jgi:hypothetical protein